MEEQSYAKHAKWVPLFHFVLGPLTLIAVIVSLWNLYRHATYGQGRVTVALLAVLSIGLFLVALLSRVFATQNQDRLIRVEENFRHYLLTGKPLAANLTVKQIVGLRFASDAELPELAKRAANEGLTMDAIKKSVKQWRPDHDRV